MGTDTHPAVQPDAAARTAQPSPHTGEAGSRRNQNKRRRHRRNQGRLRTKVCGNKNLADPANINVKRTETHRRIISDQTELDAALSGYPDTDETVAIQGGSPEKPLVVRHRTRVPPVVLDGSFVVIRGRARASVYGTGSVITAFDTARIWVHGENHATVFDEVKAEVCGSSTVCAYDHTHTALFHEAAGEIHGQARCKCKQQSSVDAYDESVIRLMDDALAVRRSDHAILVDAGGKPYFDEHGSVHEVALNRYRPLP